MFVRTSKYRHIFTKENKKEESYMCLEPSGGDSNWISVNEKFFAVCWKSIGGGQFYVGDIKKFGKASPSPFMFKGHKAAVLDLQFSPFDPNLIATVSEDCTLMLWRVPNDLELTAHITEPILTLKGHSKKVTFVKFSPVAENLIATSSHDGTIKIWDLVEAKEMITLKGFGGPVQHFDWSYNGDKIVATCADKHVRVFDPRKSTEPIFSTLAHSSNKMTRCCWLGKWDWFISVGFTKRGQREFCIWNATDKGEPLQRIVMDNSASQLMPFFDADTSTFYLAGRGDGNIFAYEIVEEDPYCHELTQHRSGVVNLGMAIVPKYACNVFECEIVRMYKVTPTSVVPISWFVPRRTTGVFQSDIYPKTRSAKAKISASEWFGGATQEPELIDLEAGYVSESSKEIDFKKQPGNVQSFDMSTKDPEKLKERIKYLESVINEGN